MAWFFEFNENSTLGDIRVFFKDEEKCKKFIDNHRKNQVGVFDAVAAFLLGGAKNNTPCTSNYCSVAFNKAKNDPSTWVQNLLTWTVGKGKGINQVKPLCSELNEQDILKTVYDKMDKWTGWKDEDKKNKVLSLLCGLNISSNQSRKFGGNNMRKDIEDIISNTINANKQVIFTGAPGTGKTWSVRKFVEEKCKNDGNIDKEQYKFVQFHPSYDYSDFVEGLRPVVIKGKEEPTFVRMDGVFKEFCRHIVDENDENKNYYFIVDEINRADLAKVFGELMFGLEESYRGKKYDEDNLDNLIQTQYKNLVTYKIIGSKDVDNINIMQGDIGTAIPIENDVFMNGFFIPENLFFIGTMNDIDRSVDSMDFALRRRFQWIDVKANEIMKSSLHSILDKDNIDTNSEKYKRIDDLAEKIISMNNTISGSDYRFGLSEAYHIGPAYFKKLDISSDDKLKASLQSTFDTNIVSILKEYTRGRKSEDVSTWIKECRRALLGDN